MKTSRELKEQRAAVEAQANEIINKAKGEENRALTDEENRSIITLTEQLGKLDLEIEAAHAREKLAARSAGSGTGGDSEDRAAQKYSFNEAFSSAMNRRGPEGFLREMHEEAVKEARAAGVSINPGAIMVPQFILERQHFGRTKRDMTAGTGTQGGYNVQTDVVGYIDALRAESIILKIGGQFIGGAVGNIDMPAENAVFTPAWETENGTADESSPSYTRVQFSPKRLAGFIDVSNQLLMQTSPAFEQYIRNQIVLGQAQAIDKVAIKGGGSNEPTGIIANSSVTVCYAGGATSNGTNADGIAPIFADAINLKTAVAKNNGLSGSLAFLTTPNVAGVWQLAKIDAGSGLFTWDSNTNKVAGYTAYENSNVPSTLTKGSSGATLSAIIFGDFSQLMVVQWGGMEILMDNYTQALDGITRMVVNTYTDLGVLKPKKFAVIKDAVAA